VGALVLMTSLLAVVLGTAVSGLFLANYIKTGAGAFFVLLGLWMILFPGVKMLISRMTFKL